MSFLVVYHKLHVVCPGNPYALLLRFVPLIYPRFLVPQHTPTYAVQYTLLRVNQPVSLSLMQPFCDDCTVSIQPALPHGLTIDETATVSGTPLEASNVTQYTVTIRSPERSTATATIVLGIRGSVLQKNSPVEEPKVIPRVLFRLNGEEVTAAQLRLKQAFELAIIPAGIDEYHVSVESSLPAFARFDGYTVRGRVDSVWNQEVTVIVTTADGSAKASIAITTEETADELFFEAIAGAGQVGCRGSTFYSFAAGETVQMDCPLPSFNSTVQCSSQEGCVYQYSLGCHTTPFFAPFGVSDVRVISMRGEPAITQVMDPVIGIVGVPLPTLVMGIEGCYSSFSIASTNTLGWRMNADGLSLGGWAIGVDQSSIRMELAGEKTVSQNFPVNIRRGPKCVV